MGNKALRDRSDDFIGKIDVRIPIDFGYPWDWHRLKKQENKSEHPTHYPLSSLVL